MKRWVYVICELVDGHPSFRHDFVEAPDESRAYEAGYRYVRQPKGEGLNDYVIELPTWEKEDC